MAIKQAPKMVWDTKLRRWRAAFFPSTKKARMTTQAKLMRNTQPFARQLFLNFLQQAARRSPR